MGVNRDWALEFETSKTSYEMIHDLHPNPCGWKEDDSETWRPRFEFGIDENGLTPVVILRFTRSRQAE